MRYLDSHVMNITTGFWNAVRDHLGMPPDRPFGPLTFVEQGSVRKAALAFGNTFLAGEEDLEEYEDVLHRMRHYKRGVFATLREFQACQAGLTAVVGCLTWQQIGHFGALHRRRDWLDWLYEALNSRGMGEQMAEVKYGEVYGADLPF